LVVQAANQGNTYDGNPEDAEYKQAVASLLYCLVKTTAALNDAEKVKVSLFGNSRECE
jgi:hypothetical protein